MSEASAVADAGTVLTTQPDQTQTSNEQQAAAPATEQAQPDAGNKPAESAEPSYQFETPEGIPLDESSASEFQAIAKELKLPQDGAKKLFDLAVKREQARLDAHQKMVGEWANTVKSDPELGKNENLAVAVKAIETFGSPELKEILNATGMGNHPAVVKFAYSVGKAISEDRFVRGGNTTPNSTAKSFYDKSAMNP